MSWILEHPLPVILIGLLTVAILAGGWLRTGRPALLYGMIAALVITGLLVLTERVVVTEREQVTATLYDLAADVQSNDLPAVLSHIHSQSTAVRSQASSELPKYEFEQVRIKRNLTVDVDMQHQPPKATARFNVVVVGSDQDQLIGRRHVPRFVTVVFYLEGDQWRVHSYQHEDPRVGLSDRRDKVGDQGAP